MVSVSKAIPPHVSKSMRSNKSSGTKPELLFSKSLWSIGVRGYRKNYKKLKGKPDICFPKHKIAVFINGCFWHRCPKCNLNIPKTNTEFWEKKFNDNVKRDANNIKTLKKLGYKVIVVWECQIKNNIDREVKRVYEAHRKVTP